MGPPIRCFVKKINPRTSYRMEAELIHTVKQYGASKSSRILRIHRVLLLHARNGIWIITGGTRKITVYFSTFYGVNSNSCNQHRENYCSHRNFSSATSNYLNNTSNYSNAVFCMSVVFDKMLISMQSIYDWAGVNPAQRKFVEGEQFLDAGRIMKCAKSSASHVVCWFWVSLLLAT